MLTLSVPHMPPLSMYGEDDSKLEQTFDEDEFLWVILESKVMVGFVKM